MNNQEVLDIAWDAARRTYKQAPSQSIHTICGQSIELVLKASVASRTLDNITGVLIAFKNFRKTLKNEGKNGELPANLQQKTPEAYRQQNLNNVLGFPNGDLTHEDVERPDNISKSDYTLPNTTTYSSSGAR